MRDTALHRIASHRPPLLPSPWHDTMVIESSLHRIASHALSIGSSHRGRRLGFEYRQQTAHIVEKCPRNLQSVSGSSVPGSPPHPTDLHCMAQRIVPSRLTCRGCSHGFSLLSPILSFVPLYVIADALSTMDEYDTRARNILFIGECMAWREIPQQHSSIR